jgi:hypothetical protein
MENNPIDFPVTDVDRIIASGVGAVAEQEDAATIDPDVLRGKVHALNGKFLVDHELITLVRRYGTEDHGSINLTKLKM